jgi:hypothetical protein
MMDSRVVYFESEKQFRLRRSQRTIRRNRWLLANAWWLIVAAVAGVVFLVAGR